MMAPLYRTGDIWDAYQESDVFIATTNGMLDREGQLVMGAGFAKQVFFEMPEAPKKLAEALKKQAHIVNGNLYMYGFVAYQDPISGRYIGALQTKTDPQKKSNMPLVIYSLAMLHKFLSHHEMGKQNVHMVFPAIGLGGLAEEDVKPWLDHFFDQRVTVWKTK